MAAYQKEEPPPAYSNYDIEGDVPGYQSNEGDPPAYPGTVPVTEPFDPPPSYESLFGRMKAAKAESSGGFDFLKKFLLLLAGTVGCTIFVGVFVAIPITMIVIGAVYMHDCPAQRFIPIYLVVAGAFGFLINMHNLKKRLFSGEEEEEGQENRNKARPIETIINCFILAWFIAGNVWIYQTYGHFSEEEGQPNFCHPTLYYFAFWITTSMYILIGLICCCVCCSGILAACISGGDEG